MGTGQGEDKMIHKIKFPDDLDNQIVAFEEALDRSFSNFVIHATKSECKKLLSKYKDVPNLLKSDVGKGESSEK